MCVFFQEKLHSVAITGCTCGDIRLSGGKHFYEGRVEICFEGMWHIIAICDDSWNDLDAEVACYQMGLLSQGI